MLFLKQNNLIMNGWLNIIVQILLACECKDTQVLEHTISQLCIVDLVLLAEPVAFFSMNLSLSRCYVHVCVCK